MIRANLPARPHVVLSAAMSIDGHLDDTRSRRLILSNAADLDRVDDVRSQVDAILIGAGTLRADDPRLLVRSPDRRRDRMAAGRDATPLRVLLTASGQADPAAAFFTTDADENPTGAAGRIVYVASPAAGAANARLGELATVVDAGDPVDLAWLLADLARRGVRRLLVEGGGGVHTSLLSAGLADELHLVIAPFLIGEKDAPTFVGPGAFRWNPDHPMHLAEVRQLDQVVLLRYLLD